MLVGQKFVRPALAMMIFRGINRRREKGMRSGETPQSLVH